MQYMNIDIETYSPHNIKSTGTYKYAEAEDFEILIIAYSLNGQEVKVIDMYEKDEELYQEFTDHLLNPHIVKHAFNANFERTCLAAHYGRSMPPEEWDDTMIRAVRVGLPMSLEKCAEVLKLSEQKDKAGTSLINYFSTPCKPTKANGGRTRNLPHHDTEKWNAYKEYCRQDVVTEKAIGDRIAPFTVTPFEKRAWEVDQHINDKGVMVDIPLMDGAVELDRIAKKENLEKAKQLTGLDNPNSPTQLLEWLNDNGAELTDLKAETVKNALKTAEGTVKEVLMIRQELSKTSVKKYTKMKDMACRDGRIRGVFQFYGAGTGRWAGRGVQLQNLTKHYMDDESLDLARYLIAQQMFDALGMTLEDSFTSILSQLVRTAFIAQEGREFAVSDFSAIEARVIAWYAEEKWRIDVFNTHGKIYEASASQMFGIPIEKIDKTTKEGAALRQKGKVSELACGFQGGIGALKAMGAVKMGVKEEDLQGLIDAWRTANPNIVNFWYSVQRAAIKTVKTGGAQYTHRLKFYMKKGFLMIELPSGRSLAYPKPYIGVNKFGSEAIKFKGVNSVTRKWEDIDTYGGKLVENIVQATARDILAESMVNLYDAGYQTVMHIHDEIVVEVPEGQNQLKEVEEIMSSQPDWAEGLPLASDGFTSKFYMKD